MKANEAPEKLYISYKGYGVFSEDGSTERTKTSQIEYIRADAFIEKACDWLINHNDYICGSTNGIVKYDMKQLVEDFKKYMED